MQNPSSSGAGPSSSIQGMPPGMPMLQQGMLPQQLQFAQTPFMQPGEGAQGSLPVDPAQLHQLAQTYQLAQNSHLQQAQSVQLRAFWQQQMQEIEQLSDFKTHNLPLARIKKIMKSDEDVRMISSEAPALFARACEIFILELTLRAWAHSEENKRRTLQRSDVAGAIAKTDIFDFLVDIVPREEFKDEAGARVGAAPAAVMPGQPLAYAHSGLQPLYYAMPPQAAMQGMPMPGGAPGQLAMAFTLPQQMSGGLGQPPPPMGQMGQLPPQAPQMGPMPPQLQMLQAQQQQQQQQQQPTQQQQQQQPQQQPTPGMQQQGTPAMQLLPQGS